MIKSVLWGTAAAAVLASAPVWAELKIGYVSYNRLLGESPQARAVQEAMQAEFMPRQRELQSLQQSLKTRDEKLQKDGATMTDDQRAREEKELRDGSRELAKKQSELQDDATARRNEELTRLQRTLNDAVGAYAKAQGYDLVVADTAVAYASPVVDITPAVLETLKTLAVKPSAAGGAPRAPAPAAAPAAPKPPSASH